MIKEKELISEYFTKYYSINKKYIYNEIDAGTIVENLTGGGMFVIVFLIIMMLLKRSVVLTTATGETLYSEPKYREYSKNFNSLEDQIKASSMDGESKKKYLAELEEIKKLQEEIKKLKENRDAELNDIFSQLTKDTAQVGDETQQAEMSKLIQEVKKGFIEANIIENLKKLIQIIKNSNYNGKNEIIKKIEAVIAKINKEKTLLQKLANFIKTFTLGIFEYLGKANLKEKASNLWNKVKSVFGSFFDRKLDDIVDKAGKGVEADPLFLEVDLEGEDKIKNTFEEYDPKINFIFSKSKKLLIYKRDDEKITFYPFEEDKFNDLFTAENSGLFLDEIEELGNVFINPTNANGGTPIDIEGFDEGSDDEASQNIKIKIKLTEDEDPNIRKIVYINNTEDEDPPGFYFNSDNDQRKEKIYYLEDFKQEDYLKLIYSYDDFIEVKSITKTVEEDFNEDDDTAPSANGATEKTRTVDTETTGVDSETIGSSIDIIEQAISSGNIDGVPEKFIKDGKINLEEILKESGSDPLKFYDAISKIISGDHTPVIKEKNNRTLHFGSFIREEGLNDIVSLGSLKINRSETNIERFLATEISPNKFKYSLNGTPETNEIFLNNVLKGTYEVAEVKSNSKPENQDKIKSFKIIRPGIIIKQPGPLDSNTKFKVEKYLKIEITYNDDTTQIFESNKKSKKLDNILLETFFNEINKKVLLESSANPDNFINIIKKNKIIAKLPKLATIEEIKKLKPSNIYLIDLKDDSLKKVDNLTNDFLSKNSDNSILLYQKSDEHEHKHTGQLFIDFKKINKEDSIFSNFLKYFDYKDNNAEKQTPESEVELVSDLEIGGQPEVVTSSFIFKKKINKILINENEVDASMLKRKSFAAEPLRLKIIDNYISGFELQIGETEKGKISTNKIEGVKKDLPNVEEEIDKNKPQVINNFDIINFFENNQLKKSTEEFLSLIKRGDKHFLKFSLNPDLLGKINELENFKEMSKEGFSSNVSINLIMEQDSYSSIDFEIEVDYDETNKKININKNNMEEIITKISGTLIKPREIFNVIFNFDIMNFFENNELKKSNEEFLSLIEKQKKYFLKFNLDSNILEEINTRSKNFQKMSKEKSPSAVSLGVITEAINYKSIQFEVEVDYNENTKEVKISGDKMKEIITNILGTRTFNRDEVFNSYKDEITSKIDDSGKFNDIYNTLKNIDYYINGKKLDDNLKSELDVIFTNEIDNAKSVAQLLKNFIIKDYGVNSPFYQGLLKYAKENDMKFFSKTEVTTETPQGEQKILFLSLEKISNGSNSLSEEVDSTDGGIIFMQEKDDEYKGVLVMLSNLTSTINFKEIKKLNEYFNLSLTDFILTEAIEIKKYSNNFISDFKLKVNVKMINDQYIIDKINTKGNFKPETKDSLSKARKEELLKVIGVPSNDPNYQDKKKKVYNQLGLPFETPKEKPTQETPTGKDSYFYLDLEDIKKNRFFLKSDTILPQSRGGVIFKLKEQKQDVNSYTGVLYVKDIKEIKIDDYNSLELLFNVNRKDYIIAEEINIESYRSGIISDDYLEVEVNNKNKRIIKFIKKGNLISDKNAELIDQLKLEYTGLGADLKGELAAEATGETTGVILIKGKKGIKIPKKKEKIRQLKDKDGIQVSYYYKTFTHYYFINITDNDNFTSILRDIVKDRHFYDSQNKRVNIQPDTIKSDMNFFKTFIPFTDESALKTLDYKFGKIPVGDVNQIGRKLVFTIPTSSNLLPSIEPTTEEKKRLEREKSQNDGQVVDNPNETPKKPEMSSFKYNMDFDSIIIERVFKR